MNKILAFAAVAVSGFFPVLAGAAYIPVTEIPGYIGQQSTTPPPMPPDMFPPTTSNYYFSVYGVDNPRQLFYLSGSEFVSVSDHPNFSSYSVNLLPPFETDTIHSIDFNAANVSSDLLLNTYFWESESGTGSNALVNVANSTMSGGLSAVGQAVSGEVGQVVIGFTAIALLLFLIAYVRKVQSRPQG